MLRSPHHIGRNPMFTETNMVDQSSRDVSNAAASVDQSSANLEVHHLFNPQEKGHPNINGLVLQPEGGFEVGSLEKVAVETNDPDRSRHRQQRCLSSPENGSPGSPSRGMQMLKPVLSRDDDRYEKSHRA